MRTKNERADQVLELFEAYYERVYIFARGSVSQNEAEDIAQEVFMRLMKHPRLDSMNVNVSYLIKIAHNLIKHGYGQKQRFQQYLEGKPDFMYEDRFDRASCQERGSETKNLDMALSSLNVDERDAVPAALADLNHHSDDHANDEDAENDGNNQCGTWGEEKRTTVFQLSEQL